MAPTSASCGFFAFPTMPRPGPWTRRRLHAAIKRIAANPTSLRIRMAAVVAVPQRAERLELPERLERAGGGDEDDGTECEPPRTARPRARTNARRFRAMASITSPPSHTDIASTWEHVGRQRERGPAGRSTHGRQGRGWPRGPARSHRRRRTTIRAAVPGGRTIMRRTSAGQHEEHEPGHPDLAEPGVPDGRDLARREYVAEALVGGVGTLEQDPPDGAHRGEDEGAREQLTHPQRGAALRARGMQRTNRPRAATRVRRTRRIAITPRSTPTVRSPCSVLLTLAVCASAALPEASAWKPHVNAPWIGWESAEVACHATV